MAEFDAPPIFLEIISQNPLIFHELYALRVILIFSYSTDIIAFRFQFTARIVKKVCKPLVIKFQQRLKILLFQTMVKVVAVNNYKNPCFFLRIHQSLKQNPAQAKGCAGGVNKAIIAKANRVSMAIVDSILSPV